MALAILLCLLAATGCQSLATLPIDERSNIRISSAPIGGNYLMISYHLNGPQPKTQTYGRWNTEIKLNGLGTLYASNREDSPALKRIEAAWHIIREEDRYGMSALHDLAVAPKAANNDKTTRPKRREKAVASTTRIPLPLSMFSVLPGWKH